MKNPMTKRQAQKKFGKDFLDSTCSKLCKGCLTPNFFTGQMWEETVPEEFECVCCGLKSNNSHPFDSFS